MIDLDQLRHSHPGLPAGVAEALATYAAIALERRHVPGVELALSIDGARSSEPMTWRPRNAADARMVDARRATEDGAECIALLLASRHRRWRIVRRLQSTLGEGADWLMEDPESKRRVVLEISGTDDGPFDRRVRQKRTQAALAERFGSPATCVVRFSDPKASIESQR